MIGDDKTRIGVTLSNEMARQVRLYADSIGVSVSSFVAMVVGEKINAYNKTMDMVKELGLASLPKPALKELDYAEEKPKAGSH